MQVLIPFENISKSLYPILAARLIQKTFQLLHINLPLSYLIEQMEYLYQMNRHFQPKLNNLFNFPIEHSLLDHPIQHLDNI